MTTHENGSGDHVHGLVSQRDQLRGWIARLDEVQSGAPTRVAERVRADYQDRLRRVTEELSAHGEEIQRNLQDTRDRLAAAEERRTQAGDALEETRLRHLIGELDDDAWEKVRGPLEDDVAAADEAVAATRAEVEHLATLASEIVGPDEVEEPAAGEAPAAVADVAVDEGDDGDDDVGGDLPFFAAEEPAAAGLGSGTGDAGTDDEADGWEPELELAGGEEPVGGMVDAGASAGETSASPSGEELAAWISEVEAESTTGGGMDAAADVPQPAASDAGAGSAADDAEGWDPFANEFGGSPAAPTTQPGDAAHDLPWLDSLDGGAAGKWAQPAASEDDDLAFLNDLDAPAAGAGAAPAADLAADDLAFLEELDRAISGGAQRSPQGGSGGTGLGDSFQGGSGGTPESTQEQPRKRGEALLCKECGAINEPQAWYCEICGSEL
jgi:ribosomal protein L40E